MSKYRKRNQYIAVATATVATILFVGGTIASAHDFGSSFEEEVGDSLIDIGYSVEEFTDDSSVIFSFEIKDETGAMADFSDVWVRIIKEQSTVFATGVHNARLGGALMTYKFPEVGEYELSVRYQNDGKKVAEAVFPLTVGRGTTSSKGAGGALYAALGFVGGLVLGVIPLMLLRRRKR